ncbi:hypothetical protein Tco_0439378 [Tanacetum coccineum]
MKTLSTLDQEPRGSDTNCRIQDLDSTRSLFNEEGRTCKATRNVQIKKYNALWDSASRRRICQRPVMFEAATVCFISLVRCFQCPPWYILSVGPSPAIGKACLVGRIKRRALAARVDQEPLIEEGRIWERVGVGALDVKSSVTLHCCYTTYDQWQSVSESLRSFT